MESVTFVPVGTEAAAVAVSDLISNRFLEDNERQGFDTLHGLAHALGIILTGAPGVYWVPREPFESLVRWAHRSSVMMMSRNTFRRILWKLSCADGFVFKTNSWWTVDRCNVPRYTISLPR